MTRRHSDGFWGRCFPRCREVGDRREWRFEVRYELFDRSCARQLCKHVRRRLGEGCLLTIGPLQGGRGDGAVGVLTLMDGRRGGYREVLRIRVSGGGRRRVVFEMTGA